MNTKICPTCKSPIPAHAPGGFCPACLLRDAEEPAPAGRAAPSLAEIAAAFPQLEIESLIGQGGMGFVYKVRQPALDRTVALKILSPELSRDPAFAERFAREARVLGKLNHPNIVTVFEHGQTTLPPESVTQHSTLNTQPFFYLLMEYVDGVNLRQAMRAGRFTPQQALAVVPGICDALQAAHAQGVWHRDIKPENILLDARGGVKIADFGIARIVGDPGRDFTLTATGAALGSAAYMAPEQHERPHDVDHRADIYSLGVVIYEMLTGELPLGRFPAPSQRATVSARIDDIVLRTLEKERELRQQSATEVKTDMQSAAQAGARAETPAAEAGSPLSRMSRLVLWSLGLLVGGAALAGTGLLIMENFRTSGGGPGGAIALALGSLAAVLGFLGALWALYEMKRGWMPTTGRNLLLGLTYWPVAAGLFWFGNAGGILLSYRHAEMQSGSGAEGWMNWPALLLGFGGALAVAKLLWHFFALPAKKPGAKSAWIGAVGALSLLCFAVGAGLGSHAVRRMNQYLAYEARTMDVMGIGNQVRVNAPEYRAQLDSALAQAAAGNETRYRIRHDSNVNAGALNTRVIVGVNDPDQRKRALFLEVFHERLRKALPPQLKLLSSGRLWTDHDIRNAVIRDSIFGVATVIALTLAGLGTVVATRRGGIAVLATAMAAIFVAATFYHPPRPAVLPIPLGNAALPAPLPQVATPEDAMQAILKAARERDKQALRAGCSRSLQAIADDETHHLSEAFNDLRRLFNDPRHLTFVRARTLNETTAEVILKSTDAAGKERETTFQMIMEDGAWKLTEVGH